MVSCSRCGFELPEGAIFCPNCGAPVKRVEEEKSLDSIARYLKLGLMGAFLSLVISVLFEAVNLYFLPSFLSALIVIYFSRVNNLKDAIIIAMANYIFADAIITSIVLGTIYMSNQTLAEYYGAYAPTIIDVVMYSISPIMAIVAGYVGFKISPKKRDEIYFRGGELGPTLIYGAEENSKNLNMFSSAFIELNNRSCGA